VTAGRLYKKIRLSKGSSNYINSLEKQTNKLHPRYRVEVFTETCQRLVQFPAKQIDNGENFAFL